MDTNTATATTETVTEAPPVTAKPNVAQPLPTSRESGLTSIAEAFKQAAKAPKTPVEKPEAAAEANEPVITETKPAAKTALLDAITEVREQAKPVAQPDPEKPSKAADWKKVKDERNAAQAEADELRARVRKLESLESEYNRLKPVAERADALERRMEEIALERSPRFQKTYVEGRNALVDEAHALAKELEVDESVVDRALAATGRKRLELLDEAFANSTAAVTHFSNLLSKVDSLEREKTNELAQHRDRLEKLSADERRRAVEEQNEEREKIMQAFDSVLPKVAKAIPDYRIMDGDEDHNAIVRENIEKARKIASGEAELEDQVAAPYLATIAPRLITENATLKKELAELKRIMAQRAANTPGLRSSSTTEESSASNGKPQGMMDAYRGRH